MEAAAVEDPRSLRTTEEGGLPTDLLTTLQITINSQEEEAGSLLEVAMATKRLLKDQREPHQPWLENWVEMAPLGWALSRA